MDSFRKCVAERRYAGRVNEDIKDADSLNITGTPGFLIGRKGKNGMIEGEIISGAQPLNSFEIVVEQYLQPKKG